MKDADVFCSDSDGPGVSRSQGGTGCGHDIIGDVNPLRRRAVKPYGPVGHSGTASGLDVVEDAPDAV
jgi:hypothetical protein